MLTAHHLLLEDKRPILLLLPRLPRVLTPEENAKFARMVELYIDITLEDHCAWRDSIRLPANRKEYVRTPASNSQTSIPFPEQPCAAGTAEIVQRDAAA